MIYVKTEFIHLNVKSRVFKETLDVENPRMLLFSQTLENVLH